MVKKRRKAACDLLKMMHDTESSSVGPEMSSIECLEMMDVQDYELSQPDTDTSRNDSIEIETDASRATQWISSAEGIRIRNE